MSISQTLRIRLVGLSGPLFRLPLSVHARAEVQIITAQKRSLTRGIRPPRICEVVWSIMHAGALMDLGVFNPWI
jgi:hypothetical protein